MLNGTIISLPKDGQGSKCDSDNYQGICFYSCLTKTYEWLLVTKYADKLKTSNLQFSFKSKHSTVMCCLSLKDVITYYQNRGSTVYACFIDASKAFDCVWHDILFQFLKQRGLPPIALRLLIDMYRRQSSRIIWDNCYSEYFGAENCVRQGGVASPILFTVYLDELLVRLEKTNVGCYIGNKWYGGLGYADDMELQCPSIKGLQKLVSTCTEFGREYGVTYNSIMSMCIAFCKGKARNVEEMPRIYLECLALSWVLRVKFLGLHINVRSNQLSFVCVILFCLQVDMLYRFNVQICMPELVI